MSGICDKESGFIEPSCQLRTTENRRNTVTKQAEGQKEVPVSAVKTLNVEVDRFHGGDQRVDPPGWIGLAESESMPGGKEHQHNCRDLIKQ